MTDPVIISRRQAADTGKTFFYTGKPCKHGHMATRYVTSGGCSACLKHTFKPKRNAWTNLLVPYNNPNLWVHASMTKAQRVALRVYVQWCIFTFIRAQPTLQGGVELETAMLEMEARLPYATAEDPTNTD